MAAARGEPLPEDLAAPFNGESDDDAESPTVGEELARVFGEAELRRRGYGERLHSFGYELPGVFARQRLERRLPMTEYAAGFELLTEEEAVRLRELAKALELERSNLLARRLRETPELAAMELVDLAVALANPQLAAVLRQRAAAWHTAHPGEPPTT